MTGPTPGRGARVLLLAYVAAYLALWTTLPLLSGWDIPADNLEQLAWVLSPDWGYNKHPPFPTWILWLFERVLPHGVPLTYALGGLCVLLMLSFAWRLARELLDSQRAIVAVLLISGVTYYTGRLHFYNHNMALMVAHAGACWCLWRAVRTGHIAWWLLLGACWGSGMLSKYQMLLTIACNVGFLALLSRHSTWRLQRLELFKGALAAAAVATIVFMPHILWLVRNDFPTFHYASHSIAAHLPLLDRPRNLGSFFGNQIGRLVPMAASTFLLLRFHRGAPLQDDAAATDPAASQVGQLFLWTQAVGPFALLLLLCLIGGMDLQMHWGTAYLWSIVLWALATAPGRRIARLPLWQIYCCVGLVQLLTVASRAI